MTPHGAIFRRPFDWMGLLAGLLLLVATCAVGAEQDLAKIPERLVVLTFDDSVKSHFTVAAPILKKYGFSATFFITERFSFATNKRDYMTWEEIRELDRQGFEIGNHTRGHLSITSKNIAELDEQ